MKHLFKATKENGEAEGVYFDTDEYSREEAEANFISYKKTSNVGNEEWFEYDGQKYKEYEYLGDYEDDDLPRNDAEVARKRIEKLRKI